VINDGIGFGVVCRDDRGCFFLETVVIDILEEKAGCGWFAELDHDVAGVQVCVNKIVKEEHVLLMVRNKKKSLR